MLYQQKSGSGPTIIFIHGNSQSSAIWDGLINERALAGYTLACLDLPGHGQSFHSNASEKDYTLKGMADLLKEFLLKTYTEQYIIVASSLGTNMIAEVITQLPQCKGLVLTGTCVMGSKFTVPEIVQPNPHFGVTFAVSPTDEELEGFLGTWAVRIEGELKQRCIRMFRETDPELRIQMGIAIAEGDWSDEVGNLEQLTYPVAVVYGKDERIIFPEYLKRSAINIWKGNVITIPGAGHCCQLDQPEVLAELIRQYASEIFKSADS